ncbi:MAG: hypothetical protein L0Y70_24955 [Gemmataceae bacterium]|nr:hypothetical protein [Gemmataceae bacterium]
MRAWGFPGVDQDQRRGLTILPQPHVAGEGGRRRRQDDAGNNAQGRERRDARREGAVGGGPHVAEGHASRPARGAGPLDELNRQTERQRDAEQQGAELALQAARLRSQFNTARIGEIQGIRGAGISFGGATREQQGDILQAARTFRQGGIGALTPGQLQQVRGTGLFNEEIDRASLARSGPAFAELRQLSGADVRGGVAGISAGQLQAAANQVRIQAEVELSFDEERIARALERSLRGLDARMQEIATRVVVADRARAANLQFTEIAGR